MLIETIVGALLPVAVESGKQLITKWVGGVKPTTIDEQIKLDQAEVARLEALARLDTPVGTPSLQVTVELQRLDLKHTA